MKNVFKEIWSQWNTADKFVTIFSLFVLSLVMLSCTKCSAQDTNNTIKDLEVYDASGEDFDSDLIPIAPEGVIDFIYCTQDNEFIIEYMDDDFFDTDNLPFQQTCCPEDEEVKYIQLFCSEEVFYEYLAYYGGLDRHDEEFHAYSRKFFIDIEFFEDEDGGYYYYKLIKKS